MSVSSTPAASSSVFGALSASSSARATHRLDLGAGRAATIWTNACDRVRYERPDGHTISLYLRGGEGTRRLDHRMGSGRPGAVCVLPQGHSSEWAISDAFEFVHLYIPDREARRFFSGHFDRDARLMALPEATFAERPRLALAMDRLAVALRAGEALLAEEAMVDALALSLGEGAERAVPIRIKGGLAPHLRRRIADHVEASLEGPLRLDDLARLADLSPFHFQRVFRESFGLSPHGYTQHRRIERARLLLRGAEPVAAIALACGFASQSHLTRVFKAETGLTPLAYRLAAKGATRPKA